MKSYQVIDFGRPLGEMDLPDPKPAGDQVVLAVKAAGVCHSDLHIWDADLGIRLARFGYRVESLDSDTWEEAPHEFINRFKQRVRWQKGWMQTLIVHARSPILFLRDLGFQRALAATTLIVGALLGGLFWPVFAADTIRRALTAGQRELTPWREASDVFVYILALFGVWVIVLPAVVAAKWRRLNLTAGALALLPLYYILLSAATWTAMFHLALWPHHWAKTLHGRSRRQPTPVVARAPRLSSS